MINLVVALGPEARPLIGHLGLERRSAASGLRVWAGDGVQLVVCGIGRTAAAAGVRRLDEAEDERSPSAWLNVGLAGHREHAVGEAYLVHKVEDEVGGGSWFPPIVFDSPIPSERLVTVERPETVYPSDALYDMEGAGFVPAAVARGTSELVQLVKIVSDNVDRPVGAVTAALAERLLGDRLGDIDRVLGAMTALQAELSSDIEPPPLEPWVERWRFSVTQLRQLGRLLARIAALDATGVPAARDLRMEPTARTVLAVLSEYLEEHPVEYGRRG